MQERSITLSSLTNAALRLLPQFLALVVIAGLAGVVVYLWTGSSKILWLPVVIFFALTFFTAPLASSAVRARRGVRLLSSAGIKTLVFSFIWGGFAAASFIATLHIGQGMETTPFEYLATFVVGGFVCAFVACVPGDR